MAQIRSVRRREDLRASSVLSLSVCWSMVPARFQERSQSVMEGQDVTNYQPDWKYLYYFNSQGSWVYALPSASPWRELVVLSHLSFTHWTKMISSLTDFLITLSSPHCRANCLESKNSHFHCPDENSYRMKFKVLTQTCPHLWSGPCCLFSLNSHHPLGYILPEQFAQYLQCAQVRGGFIVSSIGIRYSAYLWLWEGPTG